MVLFPIIMAALIAESYLWLMAADAKCSSRWSMARIIKAMLDVLSRKKNNVVSLKF
jgi:hypothetical protein